MLIGLHYASSQYILRDHEWPRKFPRLMKPDRTERHPDNQGMLFRKTFPEVVDEHLYSLETQVDILFLF